MSRILEPSDGTPTVEAKEREERAAYWATRVNSGAMSSREEAELQTWASEDLRNQGAFARAMAANAYCDRAVALGIPYPAETTHALHGDDSRTIDRDQRADLTQHRGISRRTWIRSGIGAVAATVIGAVGAKNWWAVQSIAASKGNVQRTALRDGSAVTLNSSAEIEVAFHDALRQVSLVTGEANFDVAKDASRPFIVNAGPLKIRVVGTSFLVRMTEPDAVSVTVREGEVDVLHGSRDLVRLTAGDLLSFSHEQMSQARLSMADVDRMGLWQRGELDLTGMTLADAAREFARYSDTRIIIDQPSVARMTVAGVYSTSDPVGFARAAAMAQGLNIAIAQDSVTLFRPD